MPHVMPCTFLLQKNHTVNEPMMIGLPQFVAIANSR
jgi:hypothetical protein